MLDHPILSPILVRRGADSSHNWGPSGLLGSFSDLTKFRGFPSRALNYGFGTFLRLLAPISVPCFPSCLAPSLHARWSAGLRSAAGDAAGLVGAAGDAAGLAEAAGDAAGCRGAAGAGWFCSGAVGFPSDGLRL